MLESRLKEIEKIIGYEFNHIDLLRQAFTRRSFSNENGGENNEILEFIGDKALEFVVMRKVIKKYCTIKNEFDIFSFHSDKTEGELTSIKKSFIEGRVLATCIDELGLAQYLLLGKSEQNINSSRHIEAIKEDLCEAIIGAITIDCNWDFNILSKAVETMMGLKNKILAKHNIKDYIILVQQWFQQEFKQLPLYEELSEPINENSYYDENEQIMFINLTYDFYENDNFFSELNQSVLKLSNDKNASNNVKNNGKVSLLNLTESRPQKKYHHIMLSFQIGETTFQFYGSSPYENYLRKLIAKNVFEFLKDNNLLHDIKYQIGEPDIDRAINQLQELYQKGYIEMPEYEFKCLPSNELIDVEMWHCTCTVKGVTCPAKSFGTSKKNAKKRAAYTILREIYNEKL